MSSGLWTLDSGHSALLIGYEFVELVEPIKLVKCVNYLKNSPAVDIFSDGDNERFL